MSPSVSLPGRTVRKLSFISFRHSDQPRRAWSVAETTSHEEFERESRTSADCAMHPAYRHESTYGIVFLQLCSVLCGERHLHTECEMIEEEPDEAPRTREGTPVSLPGQARLCKGPGLRRSEFARSRQACRRPKDRVDSRAIGEWTSFAGRGMYANISGSVRDMRKFGNRVFDVHSSLFGQKRKVMSGPSTNSFKTSCFNSLKTTRDVLGLEPRNFTMFSGRKLFQVSR